MCRALPPGEHCWPTARDSISLYCHAPTINKIPLFGPKTAHFFEDDDSGLKEIHGRLAWRPWILFEFGRIDDGHPEIFRWET